MNENSHQAVIRVIDVTKRFKSSTALSHVSMEFEAGRIYGLIGRNGSGKTVLLKCISGFMQPTEGRILIRGKEQDRRYPDRMGIILEDPGFIGNLSGFRNLKLLASIKGTIDDRKIKETISLVGLDPDDGKKVKNYSLGMKQRLGIAQAIMEDPDILLLDEPMNGLDSDGVRDIREVLLKLKEKGTLIIIASHYKEDIEILCDKTWVLDHGTATEQETDRHVTNK